MTSAGDPGAALQQALRHLLDRRAADASVCPSEAARAVAGDDPEHWRALMPAARDAAARLVEAGEAVVTQGGEVVDVRTARGPMRVRRTGQACSTGHQ